LVEAWGAVEFKNIASNEQVPITFKYKTNCELVILESNKGENECLIHPKNQLKHVKATKSEREKDKSHLNSLFIIH